MNEGLNTNYQEGQELRMNPQEQGRDWIEQKRILESIFRSFEENPEALVEIIRRRSGSVEGGNNGLQA
jgi:hypothetical protein